MTVKAIDPNGTLRTVPAIRLRDATGALRLIKEGWLRDAANTPRQFFAPPTGQVFPDTIVDGHAVPDYPVTLSTDQSGGIYMYNGLAPITYQWVFVSGSAALICDSPTSQTTKWHAFFTGNATYVAVWRGTATDAAGQTITETISVSLNGTGV